MKKQRVIEVFVLDTDDISPDTLSKELPLIAEASPSQAYGDNTAVHGARERARQLQIWPHGNISGVPLLSPFRYPGGKTWLVPVLKHWLAKQQPLSNFVEPFAGGAIVGLTVAFNCLADHVTLIELDDAVSAVWNTILNGDFKALADRIATFNLDDVDDALNGADDQLSLEEIAFRTILRNRINRGGILAPGAGRLKRGENGRGLGSRWYPITLQRRILQIAAIRTRISFLQEDGVAALTSSLERTDTAYFIDPPYMSPDKGRRLYAVHDVDHEHLFWLASRLKGAWLMTYEDAKPVRELAKQYKLDTRVIVMKNTFHVLKRELIVGRDFDKWLPTTAVSENTSLISLPESE